MAKVTITFDNGPEADITHYVLDVLKKFNIKVTFFVIGRKLLKNDGLNAVIRAKNEGHWIGNHSYSHTISLGDSDDPDIFDKEVTQTQKLIGNLTHPNLLFRPFCNAGIINSRVFKRAHISDLSIGGYTCVMFNAITRDWEDRDGWVATGIQEIESRPWSTLVLHDIAGWPDGNIVGSMQRLEEFLHLLHEGGHEVVQELDPKCMPMQNGKILESMDHLVN